MATDFGDKKRFGLNKRAFTQLVSEKLDRRYFEYPAQYRISHSGIGAKNLVVNAEIFGFPDHYINDNFSNFIRFKK